MLVASAVRESISVEARWMKWLASKLKFDFNAVAGLLIKLIISRRITDIVAVGGSVGARDEVRRTATCNAN